MLAVQTDFPHAGSQAFLKPSAELCRIIRHNPSAGTVLVMLASSRDASATRTVPLTELAATAADAFPKLTRRQRRAR